MAIDVLDILRARKMSPMEDHFERICLPYPMTFYLSPQDIEALRKIATSVKLAGKIREKYKMIDDIMRARGFKRFAAGTNRVVYSYYEDTSFLVKIAVDRVGMQDNPMEYRNQFFLKPYVSKMFCISPCGTVGFAERVIPIKNIGEFKEIASDVFDILVTKFLGKYVVEDVGTKYFMNWGIRIGHGPVLLDYPYVYKLDGKKLYCNEYLPDFNCICEGEIDYNSGFNHLVCSKCGKIYLAVDLRDDTPDNKKIIAKGGYSMKVQLIRGGNVVYDPIQMDDVITKQRPTKKPVGEQKLVAILQGRAISHSDRNDEKNEQQIAETKANDVVSPETIPTEDNPANNVVEETATDTEVESGGIEVNNIPPMVSESSNEDGDFEEQSELHENENNTLLATFETADTGSDKSTLYISEKPITSEPETNNAEESSTEGSNMGVRYVNTPTGVRAVGPNGKFVSMKTTGSNKRDRKSGNTTAFIPAKH